MIKLIGTKPLYMWQKDRLILVENESVKWVEFAHDGDKIAQRVEVKELDKIPVADIPNDLLQSEERIHVWFVDEDGNTISGGFLHPTWRKQPPDYVYTPTEIKSYVSLEKRIEALEKNGGGGSVDLTEIEADITELQEDVSQLSEDKADKITSSSFTNGTLSVVDGAEYRASENINNLTIVYPQNDFECWIKFTTAIEGEITIILTESKYIGSIPNFSNGEIWELSIKDGVVIGGASS